MVTGASSGIGRAIARELAGEGVHLVLLARREERLRQLADELSTGDTRVNIVAGDVTDPAVRHQAIGLAQTELGGLDVLVNNAGISAHGRFVDAQPERLRRIMEVNFFAAAELIREAAPVLVEGRQPLVVNVGSVLGHRGIPHTSEYCTSKFALHGLSDSIRPELARLGIDLLVVSPGATKTELNEHLIDRLGDRPWRELEGVPAERVARAAVRGMRRGSREVFCDWGGWWFVVASQICPRCVDWVLKRYG